MTCAANGPIWITQCLCSDRHCILAIAFNPREMTPEDSVSKLKDWVTAAIAAGELNPWCALCESRSFHYESAPTRFRTMDEAKPELFAMQARQLFSQALILASRRQPQ